MTPRLLRSLLASMLGLGFLLGVAASYVARHLSWTP